jgi:hypothetical protein
MTEYLTDEKLSEMVRPATEAVPVGSKWRHSKSGGDYIAEGVALSEGGQEPVVIYRSTREGSVAWVRVARDFLDGRFVRSDLTQDEATL